MQQAVIKADGLHDIVLLSCRFKTNGQGLHCLDCHDCLVAVGADGSVLFWDRRKGTDQTQTLAEFVDTHEAEVTQVGMWELQPRKFCQGFLSKKHPFPSLQ